MSELYLAVESVLFPEYRYRCCLTQLRKLPLLLVYKLIHELINSGTCI